MSHTELIIQNMNKNNAIVRLSEWKYQDKSSYSLRNVWNYILHH